jgi:hypothetical protein
VKFANATIPTTLPCLSLGPRDEAHILGKTGNFTHLPGGPTSRLLLVLVHTFTGWVEAFPYSSEKAQEVIKVLINEIIPRFGLPQTLQSGNGLAFGAKVTQGISKALEIKYHLHCTWRP